MRVFIILLIGLLVRLIGIASRPIWYDEAFSILFSEKGIGQMLYGTLAPTGAGSADIHPLGYYSLLWLWMKIFGESLVAVRVLSILAGLSSVYLVYLISLELFNVKTAETALLITAFMPFQIHYAQEIRMYAFLTLWLLLATYSFLSGEKTHNWRWWSIFALACALAQYTHNLAVFFLIPLAAIPLIKTDWRTLRAVVIAGGVAIILYAPWLFQLPSQFTKVSQGYWISKPGFSSIFNLLLAYNIYIPLPSSWVMSGLTISILIFILGITQTLRTKSGNSKTNGLWILYLSFAPPVLLFLFSQWIPLYIERALLPSSAVYCIWLAWVIHNTKLLNTGRNILSTLLIIAFSSGLYQHFVYRGFPYGPFRDITSYLQSNIRPGDVVIHSNKLSFLPTKYFDETLPQKFINDPPGSTGNTLAFATQQVLRITGESDIKSAVDNGVKRVWYIIYQRSIDEYTQIGSSTHPDIDYLNSYFIFESQQTWDELQILLFTKAQ